MKVETTTSGDFAENTVSKTSDIQDADVLSDLYTIIHKDGKSVVSLAHEVRKHLKSKASNGAIDFDSSMFLGKDGSSDISKWCYASNQIDIIDPCKANDNDGSIGRFFWRATKHTASDYSDYSNKYDSIETVKLDEVAPYEREILDLLDYDGLSDSDTVEVPVTSNGNHIPVVVLSDDVQDALPGDFELCNYEEAFERLETLYTEMFGEVEVTEDSDESNDTTNNDESELSSALPEEVFDPTEVAGIGDSVGEELLTHMVQEQVTVSDSDLEAYEEALDIEVIDLSDYNQKKVALLRKKGWDDDEIELFLSMD